MDFKTSIIALVEKNLAMKARHTIYLSVANYFFYLLLFHN